MKYFTIFLLFLSSTALFGQTKIQLKLDDGKGFFAAYPPPENPKGILIILPDYLESEDQFLRNHTIMNQAYTQGIVTVVVTVGRKLFANSSMVDLITEVCEKTLDGFEVPSDKVVFGGYGYGGTILLKYAQLALKYKKDFPITPAAVYTVNAPIDISLVYHGYVRQIERNISVESNERAKNFQEIILRTLEGTPEEDPFIYQSVSPYIYGSKSVDNIEMLSDTPIRLYHDVDLLWNMKFQKKSAFDMQSTAASELIYQLWKLGNNKAELKGMESAGGSSNTASRQMTINERELIRWMTEQLDIE